MKNFTLLSIVFFFTTFAFGQTPCSPISPLDCSEVSVNLPVNLDFNLSSPNTVLDNGGSGTGFTAVLEHSEARRTAAGDLQISNPNLNGYEPSLLTLTGGSLEMASQAGIAFRNPNLTNGSSNNNNQVNTLGVGFDNLQEKITISTKLLNIVTGGSAAQAGIWFGFDEDNFVKLDINGDNVELRVESNGFSGNGTTGLDQIQTNLSASGNDVVLELVVDPVTLTAEAFHTIGTNSRASLGSLPIPFNYFSGRDINGTGGQDNMSFAGIFVSHRNGSQFTARFDEFSVEGPAPLQPVSAPYRVNVAGGDYILNGDLFEAEDTSYLVGTSETSTNGYTVVGGNEDLYVPRRFGADFGYAFPITNGDYQVVLHMVENFQTAPNARIFDVIMEDIVVIDDIDLFVTAGEKTPYIESFDVTVSDGELNIDFLATVDGGIVMAIEILPLALSDATEILTFAITGETAPANIDTGAGTIALEVENGTGLTGLAPTITLSDGATISPLSEVAQDFDAGAVTYTVTAEDGITIQEYDVTVTEALPPVSIETDVTAFTLPEQTGDASIDNVAGTIAIEVDNGTDFTTLSPTITLSDGATINPLEGLNSDLGDGSAIYTVTAEDGITTKEFTVTVAEAPASFTAFINFQNNPSDTPPPAGYLPDYGKDFGNASVTVNSIDYAYGWKLLATDAPWDASDEALSNSIGVGRLRLGDITDYNNADIPTKLTGTLVHFQGDNIAGWADGQPRKNELYWELEVPNGTYEVTLGLGDKSPGNIDSRHTATLEGYTIIPAFRPNDTETRVATMIVEVTDGALTMNGLGGFNSKITHIEVVESTGTPVSGVLTFTPNTASPSLAAGATGSFSSTLSGDGATAIALNIEDDPVNATADNFNDWLSLPATNVLGEFTFAIDASTLVASDTRNNRIIATAAGFEPAILDADLTVIEAPIVPIATPFRMNVAGGDYTLNGDLFEAEDTSYLVGTSETSTNGYTVVGGNEDLYVPRRFGADFGYAFPITNGDYQVVLHMVENFQTAPNARIFDVIMEDIVVIDDIDLFVTAGEKTPYVESFDVTVADGELNVDFLASINGGILMGIEILPVVQSDATEILTFAIAGETGAASTDTGAGTVSLEVANGTGLTGLEPTITLSDGATILPLSGVAQDFDAGAVTYMVTAEDGTTTQEYAVTVTEEAPPVSMETDVTAFTLTEQTGDAVIDTEAGTIAIEVANGTDFTTLSPTITLSAGAIIDPVEGLNTDLDDGTASYTVTAEDGFTTKVYSVTVTEAAVPFAALINFQNNPSFTTPPTGYLADYGKEFGNAAVTVNSTDYNFGWKLLSNDSPIDISNEAANNGGTGATGGAGRNRIAGTYSGASDQEKLEGTLMHFQGDNIAGWADGQPRKNELYWELEVPNGTYEVTLGLGDKSPGNIDSRHTATLEGYTIIPAFRPNDTETRVATMIVEVTDGALTMNGLGGFNSKITHIEVVESTGTPVSGVLTFTPNTASPSLAAGATGSFSSTLSGDGATAIALNIEDDPVNATADNFNDWLSLPATNVLGEFTFAIDASTLVASDTRNNRIIATAAGFEPAILDADLTVAEGAPNSFALIEDFDGYTPSTGDLVVLSNGDWVKQSGEEGLAGIPVLEEGLTPNTTHSLEINNASTIAVHDFQKLIDAPVALEANVPFYYGTYFQVTELGASDGNRIRVAIRVDDGSGEAGAGWVRHIIGNYGGTYFARMGLGGSNSDNGQTAIEPDQLLQFVVKGSWDGAGTINYEYTIAPTLVEGDNTWVAATGSQSVTGTPELGRIFISSTSTANIGKVGPIRLSTDYAQVVTEEITEEASPCSPFSTLPCDQIVTNTSVDLSFDGTEGGLNDTGFTMVDPYSGTRVPEDGSPSNEDVPGYEPGNLALTGDNLVITANKGIAYLDNNAQINTLGLGLQNINSPITIETKLLGITTGGSAAQAGLWFGSDDENFVKLNVNGDNIEMRREIGGLSANGADTPDQIQVNGLGTSGQDVTLRLVVDPVAETLTAFYSINDAEFVQLTKTNFPNIALPAAYISGKEIDPEVGNASFAGVYSTYRNNASSFDATFDYFKVSEQPFLSFDVAELNFTGVVGESIAPQTVTLSASSGNPTIILSDEPDSGTWLILPENPVVGEIEFGIAEGLLPGVDYRTTIMAIEQPDNVGYVTAEINISVEITEPINDFAVNINFSDPATAAPDNYEKDSGDAYGDRGNGLSYGWLTLGNTPIDLTQNTRNRNSTVSLLEKTLIHMQYGDTGGSNGVSTEGKWEIEVPNGTYNVVVSVGDPSLDGTDPIDTTPFHSLNAEGISLVDRYTPIRVANDPRQFTTGSAIVTVGDGRLTLDASGGFNSKINYVQITATTVGFQTPRVVGVDPNDGAIGVPVNASISANELFLPNLDASNKSGVNNSTITNNTVKLIKVQNGNEVLSTVNGTGGGDGINLVPSAPLEANTQYRFEIDGVEDIVGVPFETFTSTFTTGSGTTGPITDLDNVSFTKADNPVASGGKYTTLTIGPDGKLYGLQINGDIDRWTIENDGTLSAKEDLDTWKGNYGNSRSSVGLAFDPDATPQNLIAYISHNSGGLNGAPAWDGKISRLTGANLETEDLIVTNLPRSTKDHLTNSITFKPGENNVLYFNQGSNTAGGAPDNTWGQRKERLLSAAALRLDLDKLPEGNWPLDAKTTMDLPTINAANVNSPTLVSAVGTTYSESGQNGIPDDGEYNPYYINAPLTLYGTGIRNAYDLVWHSNGQLYIPTNGTNTGSNSPASEDGTRRPNGNFYDHDEISGNYPIIPATNANDKQKDWLFRLNPFNPLGYYGHPNPYRGEYVLNRGDIDESNSEYDGVEPDINYRGAAFDFDFNKSPNGVIEYTSNAENGNLTGALLVVRYSGSSDIIALVPDGPNGDINTFKEGIPGFSGFGDPLDLVEDVSTGNIYVSDYGRSEIILLRPSAQAAPEALIVLDTEEVVGDAVTSNDYIQEILLSNLGNATLEGISASIIGPDSNQFFFNSLVNSLNAQNSSAFNVVFTPTSAGPKFAQLIISGTGVEDVIVPLSGLGKQGTGGSNEPSLQWILDTQLGSGVVNVGDEDPATNIFNPTSGLNYNSLLGDELDIQSFERALDAPVAIEVLSVFGPTANNPVVAFGWYETGNASTANELFTVNNSPTSNGQRLDPPLIGLDQFDPGTQSFGFYSRWPFFENRQLFSEDALNTFSGAIPHHVRVYELPGEDDAYIIATEEHISGFDYQDIVVIVRNIRPAGENPLVACSPISILDCDQLEVSLPFSLNFDGLEGGLSNTGFTMVDNPSSRIAIDGPVSNLNVPGYEPSKLSFQNGNLIINANNGISFVTNGTATGTSTDVNSQINTLGVGIDASSYDSFNIQTTIVNPYSDATNDSEQAGLWFGLNEDNFVKLIANGNSQIELRSELNGVSNNIDQVIATVPNLNNSSVTLRLHVNVELNSLVAFYSLNGGLETELGSLPLPNSYVVGNSTYQDLSFTGVFASKRREEVADVSYTFTDFSITSVNTPVVFEPVRINFSRAEDVPPTGYLLDSGQGFASRNDYEYGWLTTNGITPLDLSGNTRNREVAGIDILRNTLLHMQYGNAGGTNGNLTEGIWEIAVPNGNYNIAVGVGDPEVDGTAGTEPFHSINIEGTSVIDRYSPLGIEGASTRFTSGTANVNVSDGRLTIDAFGGFNTKINSLVITQGTEITEPFFANVNPSNNEVAVRISDFQINVEVIVPNDYEIDISTLAGNINLFEVTASGDVLIPSNSNDTGGGDAITLTPIDELKELTTYRFVLTDDIEANRRGELTDRIPFRAFESTFTTGEIDDDDTPIRDLTGVEFTKVSGVANLGPGVDNQRFSSLLVGPDDKLYASTIGDFNSDGQIFRWDMALDGSLSNLEVLTPALQGSPHPVTNAAGNNDRLIIGLAFDPSSTAENLIAYVTHSKASITGGPEWDGKLTRLSGPDLSTVEDILIHLPRSVNDHLTNSVIFDAQGDIYINQGSNSAGGDPDGNWGNRPERLLAAAVLKLELDKLPNTLPLSVYTTDDIAVINNAPISSILMSNNTYNPYATNSPVTIFSSGIRNAYDLVWHSNGWLYVPTNGTAGNNNSSPNSPSTSDYPLAKRIDGLTTIPNVPALRGGETQKDWLFKTKGGSYHGHPNPYRGEFVLNHGGISYSGLPGQVEASYTDVAKYPDNLQPDPNYREPAFDFGKNKSPNGVIEYKSDAFGGKLQGLLMVVRFSGQDDLLVLDPKTNGDIAEAYNSIPGLGGFDDPLDVVEDPKTGNIYISEYDRDNNGTPRLTLLRAAIPASIGPEIVAVPEELIFEMTVNDEGQNTDTKLVEVRNNGNEVLNITGATITGIFADQYASVSPPGPVSLQPGESETYTVVYAPSLDNSNLGYQEAALNIESDDSNNPSFEIGLHGLKKAGFEGGQEPALQDVVDALGIGINVGWTSLVYNTSPNPVGDEVEAERWVKASEGQINITPVGRYSPAETLPFGWYTNNGNTPATIVTNEVGVLAGGISNAQTLFPPIASGDSSFDPQGAVFGFYVESESFGRFNYSEDAINTGGVAHRTRIYPMADRDGNPIENSYLITFEDASNGDYQDYMFIIDNVIPFEDGLLVLDFNQESLDFIASLNQEDIPVQQISLTGTGGVVSTEVSLESTEEWVVLPESFDLNSPFDIGIDNTGLGNGFYTATVTATSPNYEAASFTVNLEITNELVYTYQFNFQTPDDVEISPEGYIDDIGQPYGVQSTVLGNLTYGWVLPGTTTPADAGVNGRNRDSGIPDGVLLQTFTIIGHPTPTTFPQYDWLVDVPNGTYSVNISVGERDFSNSNHVLDVNGTEVINFNQDLDTEGIIYAEDTKFVEVTDGTLRMSLGTGGFNAKPNYIRLAPLNTSLLPPTILATFDGNNSDADTYRGPVNITLEARDESDSGSIVRLEYNLDDSGVQAYTTPLTVSEAGAHVLEVAAEDANGNTTVEIFNFTIETPTGALLAIENMTKVPGTDRGFPADDYYTFHRLGNPGQALVHDSNVMRLNNTGTGELIVTDAILSDSNDYTYEVLDETGTAAELPIVITPGSFADLDITFVGTTGTGSNGIFVGDIEIVSNADNALENSATLHGAYSPQPEGGDEINAQEVFDAFGFQTSMLSIVNDEGTITPPNNLTFRPSSNYPLAANVEAGYEGDMILSDNFVQADPSMPVIGIQLSALHGTGSNGARFVQTGTNTGTVGGINFSHNPAYYQTLLPKAQNSNTVINNDNSTSIAGSFRIAVSNYLTSGGNNISGDRPDLLGARVYKVIDHNGNIIPNEYIVLQDFVQNGCGAGSANCDWNDNTFYFINIRPEGVPTSLPVDDLFVNTEEEFDLDIAQSFDSGYPGNTLSYSIRVEDGEMPSWIQIDSQTGNLSGIPPIDAPISLDLIVEAIDTNGLVASTNINIQVNLAPIAIDDEVTLFQNVVTLLDGLLTNDSEPNGQEFSITSVETPLNGKTEIQEGGTAIIYTPDFDYVGSDSFAYTIEDETGLTSSAIVSLMIAPENQAPVAIIESNVDGGQAALFVEFTGSNSTDENPGTLNYAWDFGDGLGASTQTNPTYTFTSSGQYIVNLIVSDSEGLFDIATKTITVSAPANTAPTAVASILPLSGTNSLNFSFDASGSSDAEGSLSYSWDFGDGTTATQAVVNHTYDSPGLYNVSLTVTDSGSLTNTVTSQIEAKDPITGDFALRINAGGPAVSFDGNDYVADVNFVGGKSYVNASATVPVLYQSERSALPPTFGYNIPLENGEYEVTLHFAEIFWGATGGGTLGSAQRIFDVVIEGATVLDDFDINAEVGPQTVTTRTFPVTITDGVLNMAFDATAPDGVNQPKLSAIEILGNGSVNESPSALAVATPLSGDAPLEVSFDGSGSTDDNGIVSYQWDFGNGDSSTNANPVYTYATAGSFEVVLTVTDEGGLTATDNLTIEVNEPVTGDFALRINAGGPAVSFDGNDYVADVNFVGGKSYVNASATVPVLYQSERSASPPAFGYNIPLENGEYEVTLHFAEIYWGATGGGTLGSAQRIFDVVIEGATVLDDFDINAEVGPQTVTTRTFPVTITDGVLNMAFDATAPDGVNQPKLSAIEILGNGAINEAPSALAVATPLSGDAPLEVSFDGSGSTDDNGIVSYQWDFGNGDSSTEANPVYVYEITGTFVATLTVTDEEGIEDTSSVEINVTVPPNTDPIAVASSDIASGDAPLEVSFDGSGSTDDNGIVSYQWDFGNGDSSTNANPVYTYATAGSFEVVLTVTDEGGLTATDNLTIEVNEPVTGDFALRINAGGPAVSFDGNDYVADVNFVGGKSYVNASATVPVLYQSERSASPPAFGYNIPLENGEYEVTLHFAEIYWGATGGGTLGSAQRIFDVVIEGATVLDDFDINAEVGPQTVTTRTFPVTITDGVLNMAFDATAPDGVNQPKLSAIEILGNGAINEAPSALAVATPLSGDAPLEVSFDGSGSTDDNGIVSYQWDFGNGDSSTEANPVYVYEITGTFVATLTVTDEEGLTDIDNLSINVEEPIVNDFALRINAGGPALTYLGEDYIADQNFVGGKSYVNASATVPVLYQTERTALPPTFGYNIPLANGEYSITLHFAEIYWGATGGGTGGTGARIFDVIIEGETVLDDFDINAVAGPQTILTRTFDVVVADGELTMAFDATAPDGADQPKLSAIEILGVNIPDIANNPADAGVNLALLPDAVLSGTVTGGRGTPQAILYDPSKNDYFVRTSYNEYGVGFRQNLGRPNAEDGFRWQVGWNSPKLINYVTFGGTYTNQPQPNSLWRISYLRNGAWTVIDEGRGGWIDSGIYEWGGESQAPIEADALRVQVYSDGNNDLVSIHLRGRGGLSNSVDDRATSTKATLIQYLPPTSIAARTSEPMNNMIIYPNPASVETTLSFEQPTNVGIIQIFDVTGRLVRTIKGGSVDKNGTPLNIQEIPAGMYFVKTTDDSGIEFQQQMLIRRQ